VTTAEKISIALPPEMVAIVRNAVATGEYASSRVTSDVVRIERIVYGGRDLVGIFGP
jgi:hypothetical protein